MFYNATLLGSVAGLTLYLVGCIAGGSVIMAINCLTVYLPFYFQATKGVSPATSGLYILALGIPNSLATVACGLLMSTTRYYIPYMMAGAAVLAVGSGLLSTLNVSSNVGHIIGCKLKSIRNPLALTSSAHLSRPLPSSWTLRISISV